MSFEFADSNIKSDLVIRIHSKSLEELFLDACKAIAESLANTKTVDKKIVKKITIKGEDLKELLFNLVEELIFLKDSETMVFNSFEIIRSTKKEVIINCYGEKIDFKKHELRNDLKAPTMHLLKVEKNDNEWIGEIVVDL